jgi:hypothetical protein
MVPTPEASSIPLKGRMLQVQRFVSVASEFGNWDMKNGTQKGQSLDIERADFQYFLFDAVPAIIISGRKKIFQSAACHDPLDYLSSVLLQINVVGIGIPEQMSPKFHCHKNTNFVAIFVEC